MSESTESDDGSGKIGSGEIQEQIPASSRAAISDGSDDEASSAHTITTSDTNSTTNVYQSENKPRLLLMGLKRSGKSSISNVVFHKMAPNETLFLEATTTIKKEAMHSFMEFQVWDLPGQIDYLDPSFDAESIFVGVGSMIWVLDAQDNYMEAIGRLTETIVHLQQSFPEIKYSVFIHKTDSLSDDYREETIRDIIQRVSDDLFDAGLENPPVSFYPTSIYDYGIFEAFSKVIQGLVPQLPVFEALLNTVAASCRFEKVYLFDVLSKIYIASDTFPDDMPTYSLCSDYIDAIVDLTEVYGWDRGPVEDNSKRARDIHSQSAESLVSNVKGYNIYLKEINTYLAVIGVSRQSNFEIEKALVDHNMQKLQNTLKSILNKC